MKHAESYTGTPRGGSQKMAVSFFVALILCMFFVLALWCEGRLDDITEADVKVFFRQGVVIVWRLVLAMLLGLVVGMERERREKPAGVRTIAMVAVGACLLSLLATTMSPDGTSRIIQGIITGIGFLGAGTIIKHQLSVEGLTTAATLWASAGVGVACGLGHYPLAILGTVAIWVVLKVMRRAEARLRAANHPPTDNVAGED